MSSAPSDLLRVKGLSHRFSGSEPRGSKPRDTAGDYQAVDNVSFDVSRAEIFGLVGESGAGKSTLARCVLGLTSPNSGQVMVNDIDTNSASGADRKALRRTVQAVFQDPLSALNPRYRVRETIREPLDWHAVGKPGDRDNRVDAALRAVDLDPRLGSRYPSELSGGQRQRLCLARALAPRPELVVLDEPVTALDVSVQATILELILRLREEHGVAFLMISHDLAVVQQVADTVGVMHQGRLVECAPAASLFAGPAHPYTHSLLGAVPVPDPSVPMHVPPQVPVGPAETDRNQCLFAPTCPQRMDECTRRIPPNTAIGLPDENRQVQCLLFDER